MPAFVATWLAPTGMVKTIEDQGHLTSMGTVLKAYGTFLDNDTLSGATVEVTLDELHILKPVEYPNASQRWLGDDEGGF